MPRIRTSKNVLLLFIFVAESAWAIESWAADQHWVGTWACAPQLTERGNLPPVPLADSTLRQFVHVTIAGKHARVRFSNAYGTNAVNINSAHIALASGKGSASDGSIDVSTDKALSFHAAPSVVIPPGETVWSDPLDSNFPPLTNLSISIYFGAVSATTINGHPGSRTTSFIIAGNRVSAPNMAAAANTAHWYILTGVDVLAEAFSRTLVILGDSITDGRGSTTDGNNRWPDALASRMAINVATSKIGILNMGIGGNGIFRGLGPSAQERFERDVLNQSGARWVIIFEGVNDIGAGRTEAPLTNAYSELIAKAHARNILAYGATITPFGGNGYYTDAHERARQAVNHWIRTSGKFDAVIDFDATVRDPATPINLLSAYNSGDGLHLSPSGYQAMASAIDLNLFAR
jgi:lysophospholipase L1-like esterase